MLWLRKAPDLRILADRDLSPPNAHTTVLLRRMEGGDAAAGDELFRLVYGELHGLARSYMAAERAEHTLQPTALVHEAWMRMIGAEEAGWNDRAHFTSVAARAMRRILIDHARRRSAAKRGSTPEREPLDDFVASYESRAVDLVALDEALDRLGELDPQLVCIVEQRFFARASTAQIAAGLDVSERTVQRGWLTAQAFLREELGADPDPES